MISPSIDLFLNHSELGVPEIDLFASSFFLLDPKDGSLGVNAFNQNWSCLPPDLLYTQNNTKDQGRKTGDPHLHLTGHREYGSAI